MSHFTVLVVANNEEELEEKLLPYHEYECTGIEKYLEWVDDIHDENLKKYNTETLEVVVKNGVFVDTKYSDNPEVKQMWKREGFGFSSSDEFIVAEGYDLLDIPFNQYYKTFAEYMENWHGYTEINPTTGKFERLTNPNSKWDWYQIGGRWSGTLLLKGNIRPESAGDGEESWAVPQKTDPFRSDYAKVKDIDFDKMKYDKYKQLQEQYLSFHDEYIKDVVVTPEQMIKYYDWVSRYDKVEEVIKDSTQYVKISNSFKKIDWVFWGLEDAAGLLNQTLDEYCVIPALTFAMIDDNGQWIQRAEMGWFGFSDKEKATNNYDVEWWNYVRDLDPEQTVYIVDCHI